MFTYPVGLLSSKIVDAILVTMTPTAGYEVGFTLNFVGSIFIDFKDGGGKEALTNGVEKTHTYTTAGTYIAEITGDLENIFRFLAGLSRITFITNLVTSTLESFQINDNLYSGTLDMSNNPISGFFFLSNNTGLTNVIFSATGNGLLTDTRCNSTGLSSLDFSNIPVSGRLWTFASSSMTSITFAASGNGVLASPLMNSCNFSSLDFSNVPLSGSPNFSSNSNLSTLTLSSTGNGVLVNFRGANCDLPNIDFSVFPTSDGVNIELSSNNMTATEHDNQLINLDATGWINGNLEIAFGNTARTSASDTAYNNLISKGWTIT